MKSDGRSKARNERRVELKYCEGCGGLGVRECGGGQIYCADCAAKMGELAVGNIRSRRPCLPLGKRSLLEEAGDSAGKHFRDDANDLDLDRNDSGELDSDQLDSDELNGMAWAAAGGAA